MKPWVKFPGFFIVDFLLFLHLGMEKTYTDQQGVRHDLDIFQDGDIYIIHRNGQYFVDLTLSEGEWIEVYEGPTERSKEYGKLLDTIFIREIE